MVGVSWTCAKTSVDMENDLRGLVDREELVDVGMGPLESLELERLSSTKWYAIAN